MNVSRAAVCPVSEEFAVRKQVSWGGVSSFPYTSEWTFGLAVFNII